MPIYHKLGNYPKKRHVQYRNAEGDLYQEELFGSRGFSGPYSLLYHRYPPTEVRMVEAVEKEMHPHFDKSSCKIRHRHFQLNKTTEDGDPIFGRKYILTNDDITIGFCHPSKPMKDFYSNGYQDEIIFVQSGKGVLQSTFGELKYKSGDYIVIPKGTIYQIEPDFDYDNWFLQIEASGNIELPSHYMNENGQLLEHSPMYTRDLVLPSNLKPVDERGKFLIYVKSRDGLMAYHREHHPFDVVGWDGYLYPWIFNIADFEPITGRVHMPPPVHQTFKGQNFVICSFVPRMVDYHPEAIPAPYNHSNLESDEVLFYSNGDFLSREGINEKSITFHPAGIPHGPQPGKMESSIGLTHTNETAVMIDTFKPLYVTKYANQYMEKDYALSWSQSSTLAQ